MLRNLMELPEVPSGPYALPPFFSVVVPVNRDVTNLVINPSFEDGSDNWVSDGGVVQTYQYAGVGSMEVSGSSSPLRAFYGNTTPLSTTSGSTYVASLWFYSARRGASFTFYIATTAGVRLNGVTFRATGYWQRVWFSYKETSTASRRLYIDTVGHIFSFVFDAVQFEVIPTGSIALPTTYIDGDQRSKTSSNIFVSYYWNGTPHASTSVRVGGTRTGGIVYNLQELGFTLSTISGLGMTIPTNTAMPFSQLDGELYQQTRKEARTFSLAGRVMGGSSSRLDQLLSSLFRAVDVDAAPDRQPLILKYQPLDEDENPAGSEVDIVCVYEGGAEGRRDNPNTETFVASFKQFGPVISGHEEGELVATNASVSNANFLIKKAADGTWSALSTGVSGGSTAINAIAEHPNGTVYIGGVFTDAGGSGADNAAIYNPLTDTFSVVKSATAFNAEVSAIVIKPNGIVYFGGSFTNVDGIAAADGIVSYNPLTNTFAALGTGVSAGTAVFALAAAVDGTLYAGGSFLLMGGVANTVRIARWDGAVWTPLGTGANGTVRCLLPMPDTTLYAGGDFTLAGGVANTIRIAFWNLAAWLPLGTGANSTVRDLALAPNGLVYVGGLFTTLNGLAIQYLGKWNGTGFSAVGSGTSITNDVRALAFDRSGSLYVGGVFINVDGTVYNDGITKFDGGSYVPLDVILPVGSAAIFEIMISRSGMLYLGTNQSGTATVPGTTTVRNHGSTRVYPIVKVSSPLVGDDLRQIINTTTRKVIYLDYFTLDGEIAVFDFDPLNGSFTSNFQGNITSKIMQGSDDGNFFLAPGDNIIKVLGTVNQFAEVRWHIPFMSMADANGVL